jgi:hypothetical protein
MTIKVKKLTNLIIVLFILKTMACCSSQSSTEKPGTDDPSDDKPTDTQNQPDSNNHNIPTDDSDNDSDTEPADTNTLVDTTPKGTDDTESADTNTPVDTTPKDTEPVDCDPEWGVFDEQNNICWQLDWPKDFKTGIDSLDYCKTLTIGGYSDWKFPSLQNFFDIIGCTSAFDGTWYEDCGPCSEAEICNFLFSSEFSRMERTPGLWTSDLSAHSRFEAILMIFAEEFSRVNYGMINPNNDALPPVEALSRCIRD